MSNRTQKSVKNMTIGMLSQLFTLWLSFVSRTVFIKFLTAEYLGISGLFSNVLTVLSFAELGIGDAMTYAMYKPVKEDNRKLVNQLMVVYKKAYTGIAVVVGAIGLGLSFFLSFIIAEPPDIPESLQLIFWLYVVNNMASYILTYKKSILIALSGKLYCFRSSTNCITYSTDCTDDSAVFHQAIYSLFNNTDFVHDFEQHYYFCCCKKKISMD